MLQSPCTLSTSLSGSVLYNRNRSDDQQISSTVRITMR